MKLTSQKKYGATVWLKFHNPNFNRFCMIHVHPCDRRTDGRTGDSIARSAYMLSRAKQLTCKQLNRTTRHKYTDSCPQDNDNSTK